MQGKRIVITRASHQAGELSLLLSQRGAEVLPYPCIAIVPPEDTTQLDLALQNLAAGAFDWLILTSANAAMILGQRLNALGLTLPPGIALACVGPATAEAAEKRLSISTRLLPEKYIAEALYEEIKAWLPARLLLLQAEKARPFLREKLTAVAALTPVVAYRTILGAGGIHLSTLLQSRQVDAITFTSASTVHNCIDRLHAEGSEHSLLADTCLACIGPLTAQAMRELGLTVGVMPAEHTIEGLVQELEIYFGSFSLSTNVRTKGPGGEGRRPRQT